MKTMSLNLLIVSIFIAGNVLASDGLLRGQPNDNAIEAIVDLNGPGVPRSDLDGYGVILTRIDALINAKATVSEVNAAIKSIGAKISSTSPPSSKVVLEIPKAKGGAEIQSKISTLVGSGAFDNAFLMSLPRTKPYKKRPNPGP